MRLDRRRVGGVGTVVAEISVCWTAACSLRGGIGRSLGEDVGGSSLGEDVGGSLEGDITGSLGADITGSLGEDVTGSLGADVGTGEVAGAGPAPTINCGNGATGGGALQNRIGGSS